MALFRDPGHKVTNRDGAVVRLIFLVPHCRRVGQTDVLAYGSDLLLPVVIAVLVEAVTKITAGVEAGQ